MLSSLCSALCVQLFVFGSDCLSSDWFVYLVNTSTWLWAWLLCQSPGMPVMPGMQFSARFTLLYTQVLTAVLKSLGFALGEGSSADQYVDACFECCSSEQNQAAIWVDDVAQYAARAAASVNSCTPEQVPTVPTVSVTVHPLTVHPLTDVSIRLLRPFREPGVLKQLRGLPLDQLNGHLRSSRTRSAQLLLGLGSCGTPARCNGAVLVPHCASLCLSVPHCASLCLTLRLLGGGA